MTGPRARVLLRLGGLLVGTVCGCGQEQRLDDAAKVLAIVFNVVLVHGVCVVVVLAESAARAASRAPSRGSMWIAVVMGLLALAGAIALGTWTIVAIGESEAGWYVTLCAAATLILLTVAGRTLHAGHRAAKALAEIG